MPMIDTIFNGKPKIKYRMAEIKNPVKIPMKAFFTIRLEPLSKIIAIIIINDITIAILRISLFSKPFILWNM